MKTLLEQKEELKKKLNNVQDKLDKEIALEHYPKIKARYEGKCFKCPNGYGGDRKWWMFIKVTEINIDDVYDTGGNGITARYKGVSFQITTSNEIQINVDDRGFVHSLGVEIKLKAFNKERDKLVARLKSVL